MKIKQFLLILIIMTMAVVHGQTIQEKFDNFAKHQDSLFHQSYKQKDVKTYQKLLSEFLHKYDKLSKTDKINFSGYLNSAYYNLCCTYSLLDNKAMAMIYFKKSIETGFIDYPNLIKDSDLVNIKKEKEFGNIVEQLRCISDYLYILKKAKEYNLNDNRSFPNFTYQSKDNPNLVVLRNTFKLDSIAGTGNEISKIINLAHWIHNLIPHDGNHANPIVKNALSMIAECKKNNRGLNCRGLATVLNECYLSIGIKSRFATCLPKDSLGLDNDCHVINMVYSNELKKWIWIDPTNDAYVMNENGELLSIEEVRERVISGKPLILNPDANWNHKMSTIKEEYLFNYMAKNLYIFECPISSEYDTETDETDKVFQYVRLLPLDYFNQVPDKTVEKNLKSNTTIIKFKTNNPTLFWQAP
ncbi:MAG: transglutaminase domain-containing protein [Bacteroidota bacterium]